MDFRCLGPVEARVDGVPVDLGEPQRRLVLALLLADVDAVVSTDRLVDGIWGDEPPQSGRKIVQGYVSGLRKALGNGDIIESRSPGYRLDVKPRQLDAGRFEDLAAEGARALANDPHRARQLLFDALSLWTGDAYEDLSDYDALRPEITRLQQLRLTTLENRIAADIYSGAAGSVVDELADLTDRHPLRERLWSLRMLALYRSGRQAEALRAFDKARQTLAADVGLEPSSELRLVEQRILDQDPVLDTLAALEPMAATVAERNPYKGLRPFQEVDAADFHGREALVRRLRESMGRTESRLIVLAGPSGSGKSSVVGAGLTPVLRAEGWSIATMYPGARPMESLVAAIDELEGPPRSLLIVDQLEEIITQAPEESQQEFLDRLAELATVEGGSWLVVTVRADFLDRLLIHPRFAGLVEPGLLLVTPLEDHEVREVIVAPASRVGVTVEPDLVAAMVHEVAHRAPTLPLLEYALTDLYDRAGGRTLTLDALEATGGISGPLARRAEELYEGLDQAGRATAQQLFLRLVTLTDEGEALRHRVTTESLAALPEIDAVLNVFGRHRLLTFDRDQDGRPTVEVAHEALLGEWPRLARWIEEQREDLLMARRLAAAVEDWESADRGEGYLLTGGGLAQHEAWTAHTELTLTTSEQDFLAASRVREDDRHRRQRRRRLGVVSGFAVAALVALVLAVLAVLARNNAEQVARTATARGLASAAAASIDEDPERSLLLALSAADTTRRVGEPVLKEAVEELYRALNQHRVVARFPLGGGVATSPDGSLLAAIRIGGAGPPAIEVRDADSGELVTVVGGEGELRERAADITFGPDSRTLAIANESDELTVWDALTGRELARMSNDAGGWPRFSPDGSRILVVGQTPTLAFLWDWEAGEEVHRFELAGGTWGADYSPDGRLVAIGERHAGAVVIFDAGSGEVVQRIEGHVGLLSSVAFSPDGTRLASSSDIPSRILVNDVATGTALLEMPSPIETVVDVAWSPDGEELAFGGNTGELVIVDAATGQERLRLSGIDGVIHSPAWFPDGNRIAVTGRPVETVVWDVREQNAASGVVVGIPQGPLPAGAWYTQDESKILVPVAPTGLSLFDVDSGAEIASQTPGGAWIDWPGWPLVSPDRKLVAMADEDGLMTIYDTQTLAVLLSVEVGMPIGGFSPDSRTIVVAPRVVGGEPVPDDTRPGLLEVATGEFVFKFDDLGERHWNSVLAIHAAFHPSGDYVAVAGPTRVYDTRTGDVVFAGDTVPNALAFSPDGSLFVLLSGSGSALLYDFEAVLAGATPEEALVREWQALDATGLAVRWTEDGSRLLVGGMDDSLVVYDREARETLLRLPTGIVTTIDFTADGERALISAEDGPRIIALDAEELFVSARSRLTRGFTATECARFFPDGGCPTFEDLRAG